MKALYYASWLITIGIATIFVIGSIGVTECSSKGSQYFPSGNAVNYSLTTKGDNK